mgnify:CR=1 FL=1
MKIALCQINTTVGDFPGNVARLLAQAEEAVSRGARIAVYPELTLPGYPPLDLLERPAFLEAAAAAESEVIARLPAGLTAVFGNVRRRPIPPVVGRALQNTAVVARRGELVARGCKALLPTYDVFDEARYFEPGDPVCFEEAGRTVAVTICEDIWNDDDLWSSHDLWRDKVVGNHRLYGRDPVTEVVSAHRPSLMLNLSASPWSMGKLPVRRQVLRHLSRKHGVWFAYANLVGANDGLVFDGHSMVYGPDGAHHATAPGWGEGVTVVDTEAGHEVEPPVVPGEPHEIREALTIGIRDYLEKTGIPRVIIGLSGGIDSAVTAALAGRALGPERVIGASMPSAHSSQGSVTDAVALADNLGIECHALPIAGVFDAYARVLEGPFAGREEDVTEENLQSRIRGGLLMALANKLGGVVLNTGNKSEAAVGYATIYGDAIGALSVLGDLYKHQVYAQAELANEDGEVIPRASITKPPSAELRPGQKDADSLPDYDALDEALRLFLEARLPAEDIAARVGLPVVEVERVIRMVYAAEFKRKQFPPTIRVSRKAWVGRIYPIVQRFRE